MSAKWTKEPWHAAETSDGFQVQAADHPIAVVSDSESSTKDMFNAVRIVQCVNACQGIPDPAAALRQAREALYDAHLALFSIAENPMLTRPQIEQMAHECHFRVIDALSALGGKP